MEEKMGSVPSMQMPGNRLWHFLIGRQGHVMASRLLAVKRRKITLVVLRRIPLSSEKAYGCRVRGDEIATE
jgi:hypothetical protein